jgi:N-acetylmuramoyl-L-alanine amidase
MRAIALGALALVLACAAAGCGGAGASSSTRGTGAATAAGLAAPADTRELTTPAAAATAAATSTPATASTPAVTTTPATPPASAPLPPRIHPWPIPYGAARRRQMAEYSLRHYGEDTYVLSNPRVIVEHYTETQTAQEAWNTFAPDVPDSEFHELPNTCAHFLVEGDGRIDQLVPLDVRCRHTTGLNWTAIGIENVGLSDAQILGDRAQMRASLALTRWLQCRYRIAPSNVIGHNESLSSPYHHDRVPAFQHQTHSDWNHADMNRYRAQLRRLPCPQTTPATAAG